jgi:hypothetical protein
MHQPQTRKVVAARPRSGWAAKYLTKCASAAELALPAPFAPRSAAFLDSRFHSISSAVATLRNARNRMDPAGTEMGTDFSPPRSTATGTVCDPN